MKINNIGEQKHIALIAHDNRKNDLLKWVKEHTNLLSRHFLCGTGTTAKMIATETLLPVRAYESGPLGGDQQISAAIVDGKVDFMIFFWDPLTSQPHDPDVKALLRIAVLYDIPVAMNVSTADFLLKSSLMEKEYIRE
nr:methylglyoxal synthase [Sedimentibacter sp.]